MTVQRWKCTSYCLCGSRKGHFEKSDDDGVWVRYEAAHALEQQNNQLRGTLSLAEEGLANYAQENEGAKHDIERLMAACNEEANEVERLKAALERIKRIGYGLELHSDAEERAEYWSAMALEYRRIAAEALRPAEPQPGEQT